MERSRINGQQIITLKAMKMKRINIVLGLLLTMAVGSNNALAQDGMIAVKSPFDVATTVDKLETVLKSKGMNIFGRVNHAEGAKKAELELRPTEVLIFGNPKVGTPLMNCSQSIAIDLPQKMLAWEDESGQVFLGYNDPMYLNRVMHRKAVTKYLKTWAQLLEILRKRQLRLKCL